MGIQAFGSSGRAQPRTGPGWVFPGPALPPTSVSAGTLTHQPPATLTLQTLPCPCWVLGQIPFSKAHYFLNPTYESRVSNCYLVASFFFLKKKCLFIYLFLAALGLCCCTRASHCGGFSCCRAQALGAWASVVVARRLSSCGLRALELRLSSCGTWA